MSPHSGQPWLLGTVAHYKKWWFWHARRTLRTGELVALAWVVVVNRKQEVRYRLMPIKKRRNASTRRDGWWFLAILWQTQAPADSSSELYGGAKRAFRPVGHPSKIHFSCSKDNLNVAGKPPLPSLSLSKIRQSSIQSVACWVVATNDSSTKHLMFQVLFSYVISCKILCKNRFFLFSYNFPKIKSFECPK